MSALTESDARKFNDLEGIIEAGLKTFVEVGAALSIIREQRLYRATHGDFETYCEERWGWNDRRASQLIQASDVVQGLSTIVGTVPANEAQARELVPVPEEKRAEVWETATKAAESEGKAPTAKHVREAGQPFRPKMPKPSKPKPPSKVDALREAREQQAEEREATPAPAPEPTVEAVPASTVVALNALMSALATVPTLGTVDAARIAEALTPADMEHVRRVRETCQRVMTEYARQSARVA
jgi:hypothetical protein